MMKICAIISNYYISSINIFSTKYLVVVYSRSILEYLVAPINFFYVYIFFFPKKKE